MLGAVKPVMALLAIMALAAPASAGRTHYAWINGTEVLPERGVELETWVQDLDNVGELARDETALWWSVTLGITDRLELALPIEMAWTRTGNTPGSTQLERWGAEARYRFAPSDPVDAPALVPLLRVAIKREVDDRRAANVELEAILTYERGCVHAIASVTGRQLFREGEDSLLVRPMAGVSIAITDELRAGVEAIASLVPRGAGTDWVAAGPSVAWTHGRFWLAASAPVGLTNIDAAPRLRWGIAF